MGLVEQYQIEVANQTRLTAAGRLNLQVPLSSSLSSLELSDTKVYEPQIRALLGTDSHFCEIVVLKLRRASPPPAASTFRLLLSSLELSDTKVYEPQMQALLGTASQLCAVADHGQTTGECTFCLSEGSARRPVTTLETTQGLIDGFFSQLPLKCYLLVVAPVED